MEELHSLICEPKNNEKIKRTPRVPADISGIGHALVTLSFYKKVPRMVDPFRPTHIPSPAVYCSPPLETGVVVTPDGLVLACAYFLYDIDHFRATGSKKLGMGEIFMTYQYNRSVGVDLVHLDTSLDLAVLKLNSSRKWQAAELGSSSNIEIGQKLLSVAVGLGVSLGLVTYQMKEFTVVSTGTCPSPCSDYFHALSDSKPMQVMRGIFVFHGKVVGLQIIRCDQSESLVHGLPIGRIVESLKLLKIESLFCSLDIPPCGESSHVSSFGRARGESSSGSGLMTLTLKA